MRPVAHGYMLNDTPARLTGDLMAAIKFTLNGKQQTVDVVPQMPLLWVLRDTIGMTGTKFGCGMALCGACTVHLDGEPMRSCMHAGFSVRARTSPPSRGSRPTDAIRCSAPGWRATSAVRILPVRPDHGGRGAPRQEQAPTDTDIDEAMRGNICRCGTYQDIRHAIHRAAEIAGRCEVSTIT